MHAIAAILLVAAFVLIFVSLMMIPPSVRGRRVADIVGGLAMLLGWGAIIAWFVAIILL